MNGPCPDASSEEPRLAEDAWFLAPPRFGGARDLTPVISLLASTSMPVFAMSSSEVTDPDGLPILVRWLDHETWRNGVEETMKGVGPDAVVLFVADDPSGDTIHAVTENTRTLLASVALGRVWMNGSEVPRFGRRRQITEDPHRETFIPFAIARALLLGPTAPTQDDLQRRFRVPRRSVLVALNVLRDHVDDTNDHVHIRNRRGLLHYALDTYSGPHGMTTRWTHPAPLDEQAHLIRSTEFSLLSTPTATTPPGRGGVFDRVIAYCYPMRHVHEDGLNLWGAGFTPATGNDCTLELTFPKDKTLPLTSPRTGWTDEIITAFNIERTATTPQQFQAATALRRSILERSSIGTQGGRSWL